MGYEFLTLEQLAAELGRDRRDVERLVQRGRIPGHRLEGEWRFHPVEVRHWVERELSGFTETELAALESGQAPSDPGEVGVADFFKPELVEYPLEGRTRRGVLEALLEVAGRTWQVWEPALVLDAILQREEVLSTALDSGVAIPHPRNPLPHALGETLVAVGRTANGIPFGGPRGALTDVFILVLARDAKTHLRTLARLGRMLQAEGFLSQLRGAETSVAIYETIIDADRRIGGDGGTSR